MYAQIVVKIKAFMQNIIDFFLESKVCVVKVLNTAIKNKYNTEENINSIPL
jgi:hypothetical protein